VLLVDAHSAVLKAALVKINVDVDIYFY
jgi:hypothetical protein